MKRSISFIFGTNTVMSTEMAPPPAPQLAPQSASASASTSTGTRTSSRPRAPVVYADADDDIEMDVGDTPRRKTRSSSKRAVASPESKAPDAQRPRIEDPVSSGYLFRDPDSFPGTEGLWAMPKQVPTL